MALLAVSMHFGLPAAILFAAVTTGILAAGMDGVILAPLRAKHAPNITCLISVMGVSYIIQNMMMILFDSTKKNFPKLFDFGNVEIFGVTLTSAQIAMFLIALVFLVLLTIIVNGTKIGLAMRAREKIRRWQILWELMCVRL